MLGIPRMELSLHGTSKGLVAGSLIMRVSEDLEIDCSTTLTGELVPQDVESIKELVSEAEFILVVEKDSSFQKLIDDNFLGTMPPCILMTGKGQFIY